MLRRIVVLRKHEWLEEGWRKRAFGPAGAQLDKAVKVKGLEFNQEIHPVPTFGRAMLDVERPSSALAYGLLDSPGKTETVPFAVVGEFDDQEAVERLKTDRSDVVLGVYADLRIEAAPGTYCSRGPVGDFRGVINALGVPNLRRAGLTGKGVRVVVVDTGIHGDHPAPSGEPIKNNIVGGYSPVPGYQPGSNPVNHGTMVAFDALLSAPNARLLDYALLQSTAGTWQGFLSDALAAYANLIDLIQREPGPLVVNNSWGLFDRSEDAPIGSPENYSANPDHPFNQIVGSLVAAGADVLFAAGNCGEQCPDGRCGANDIGPGASIHGANSHPAVITVAAVTVDKARLGYSSQGPGALYRRKPDLAAYSHFSGSGVYAADGGTSAACPVATGVVAALREGSPKLSPEVVKGTLQKTAELDDGGWNFDTGYGILNAKNAWQAANSRAKGAKRAKARARKKEVKLQPAWMHEPTPPAKLEEYIGRLRAAMKRKH